MKKERENYNYIMDKIIAGDLEKLEKIARSHDNFPDGKDNFIGRNWIINAIDCGSKKVIEWMLSQQVNLDFVDEEGYGVIFSAIERNKEDKYEILQLLLDYGAPTHLIGLNGWTALHMAAARNDVKALKILVDRGADLSVKTKIDYYATPLEEARYLGCTEAVKYLETVS